MTEVKLKDITLNITDGKHGDCESEENSGFYFISCKDIYDGAIHYHRARQITEYAYIDIHKRTMLEPNDILVTNSGTIGRMALVKNAPETFRTTFQKSVAIIKPNQEVVTPVYLYYSLLNCVNQFINQSNGAAQKNLLLGTMREFRLTIEESVEQQDKIANVLRTYDVLIENNQKQIKLLEEVAQRLYKEWFVDLRFPGYEDVKIVDGVPEGWKNIKLVDIADIIMGQSPKSEFYNNEQVGIPFHQGVGSYGRRFVIDEVYSTSYTRIAEENSILFSVRAPVGRLNITKNKIVIGRGLAAIKHKQGYQSYLFYLLKERFFKDNLVGNGAIFASITKDELLNQIFLVANEKLVVSYDEIVRNIDAKINALDSQIDLLVQARNRLLPKLMSGEIEV